MTDDREEYWQRVRERAAELGSDGCTGVPDFYIRCCWEHDIAASTGRDLAGTPVTWAQAAETFRRCIQAHSPLGVFSPLSWWRWGAVRLHGWWNDRRLAGDLPVASPYASAQT